MECCVDWVIKNLPSERSPVLPKSYVGGREFQAGRMEANGLEEREGKRKKAGRDAPQPREGIAKRWHLYSAWCMHFGFYSSLAGKSWRDLNCGLI